MSDTEQPGAGPSESSQSLFETTPEPQTTTTPEAAAGGETSGLPVQTTDETEGMTPEELEEIEYEGKRARVPKEMKDAFLRQQDYTRKTQEVAEARRTWEQTQQASHQMLQLREQTIAEHAEVLAVDKQIKQFDQVNWDQLTQEQALKLHMALTSLKDQRANLAQGISQKQQAMTFHQQQFAAKQAEEGRRELERDIKGWSPELASKLMQTAKSMGFRDEELAQVSDPRTVKLLHEAYLYRQSLAKQAQKPAAAPLPKPVTKVGGGNATNTKAYSDLSAEEHRARRNEERYGNRR